MKNKCEVFGDTVRIYLKRKNAPDLYTTIDLADLEKVASRSGSWYALRMGKQSKANYAYMNTSYDERRAGMCNGVAMHRLIMDTPDDLQVDHLNHNTLDNRRENLKNVTQLDNNLNKRFFVRRKTKGYCWSDAANSWIVSVRMEKNKPPRNIYFKTESEARAEAERLLEMRRQARLVIGEQVGADEIIRRQSGEGDSSMAGC